MYPKIATWSFLFLLTTSVAFAFGQKANAASYDGQQVVDEAYEYLGTPYQFGGDTPEAFDCSGFVQYVYEEAVDMHLPRSSYQQWKYGEPVDRSDLEPGDAVFFKHETEDRISHNAIYAGDNKIIHATISEGVTVQELNSGSYWDTRYEGARRYYSVEDSTLIKEAKKHLGTPYQRGGTTPTGFDTAGFTQYVYKEALDIELPRWVNEQWEKGNAVSRENVRQGDLVFFSTRSDGEVNNVGIYYENDQFVHVSTSEGVTISYITSDFWKSKYKGARRVQ